MASPSICATLIFTAYPTPSTQKKASTWGGVEVVLGWFGLGWVGLSGVDPAQGRPWRIGLSWEGVCKTGQQQRQKECART